MANPFFQRNLKPIPVQAFAVDCSHSASTRTEALRPDEEAQRSLQREHSALPPEKAKGRPSLEFGHRDPGEPDTEPSRPRRGRPQPLAVGPFQVDQSAPNPKPQTHLQQPGEALAACSCRNQKEPVRSDPYAGNERPQERRLHARDSGLPPDQPHRPDARSRQKRPADQDKDDDAERAAAPRVRRRAQPRPEQAESDGGRQLGRPLQRLEHQGELRAAGRGARTPASPRHGSAARLEDPVPPRERGPGWRQRSLLELQPARPESADRGRAAAGQKPEVPGSGELPAGQKR